MRSTNILVISPQLDLSIINLDGTHCLAKKGRETVTYQERKKAKTTNIPLFSDVQGNIISSTEITAGNHNDAYDLANRLHQAFRKMKELQFKIMGSFFNADRAFDTKEVRKTCFNYGLILNIFENNRGRKK